MKRAALLVILALGACSPVPDTAHDFYGNVFPADCPASITQDSALLARAVIVRAHVTGANGTTTLSAVPVITLDPSLTGWALEDTFRHEACHALHYLNGNPDGGDWHARQVPNRFPPPRCADPFHC